MAKINLDKKRVITMADAVKVKTDSIDLKHIIDSIHNKNVTAYYTVGESRMQALVLWADKDYDKIGDWTTKQAMKRINELL